MHKCDPPTPLAREMDLLCVHKVLKTLMRGSTKCYNFYVLENWQREGDTKDDRSTACESFYFIYGKDYYNVSYKDSWVLNGLGEPAVKKTMWPSDYDVSHCWLPLWRARPWGQSMQEFDCSSFPGWSRQQFLLNQSLHWKHLKQIITRKMSVTKWMLNSFLKIVSRGRGFRPITGSVPSFFLSH